VALLDIVTCFDLKVFFTLCAALVINPFFILLAFFCNTKLIVTILHEWSHISRALVLHGLWSDKILSSNIIGTTLWILQLLHFLLLHYIYTAALQRHVTSLTVLLEYILSKLGNCNNYNQCAVP